MNHICSDCKKVITPESHITGYAVAEGNLKVCYDCCGIRDGEKLLNMSVRQRSMLYLSNGVVTNFPGTLKIKPYMARKGRHNMAKIRHTVYFNYKGCHFIGVNYGSNSEVLHIKKLKVY